MISIYFKHLKVNVNSLTAFICELLIASECDLRQMNDDKRYAYITYQDLRKVPEYKKQTVMVIKAPPEASLNVIPAENNEVSGSLT